MIILLYALLFLMIFMLTFTIGKIIYEKNVVNKVVESFEERYKKKIEIEEKRRSVEGNLTKNKFLNNFDEMLDRSGLKEKFSLLNSETYVLSTLLIALLFYLVSKIIYNYWVFNLLISIAICFISYLIIYYRSGIVFEKIDNNIMSFINNIENFSTTSKDIVSIFEEVIPYTEDPLTRYIREFVNTAKISGDVRGAFEKLERRMENDKLVTLLKNLEIASRHSANYTEIIREARVIFNGYFKAKTKRKIVISNGRATILLILILGLVMIATVNAFVDGILVFYLRTTMIGNLIMLFGILIVIMALWIFIGLDRG